MLGIPRATFDVDLLVDADDAGVTESLASLERHGFGVDAIYESGWRDRVRDMPLVKVQMFRDGRAVSPFVTFNGASTMSVNHPLPGSVTLSIAGAGLTPVLMAFGGTPISVPLWPYVTVLVSPDVLIGTTTGSITLQLPPLPPGTLYAQGLVIDSVGTLRGTNSVRFLWL